MWPLIVVIAFTLLSGYADAQGFSYSSSMWRDGQLVWPETGKAALGFAVGISAYWVVVRFLQDLGVRATEVQTLMWIGVTLIGVALVSGEFFRWQRTDQAVALAVLGGIGGC